MAGNAVYVVTGANRGLGLGLVKALVRPATTVIASVRNAQAGAALEAEAEATTPGEGSVLHVLELDFSAAIAPETIARAFRDAVGDAVSHVDVLVNNAGFCPPPVPVADTSAEDMRAAFEVNTIAPVLVFQALWPLLQRAASAAPKVIMVTSSIGGIAVQEPLPGGAYGASKAALNWFTRSLHLQNEASGLVAVALHPGWVRTRSGQLVADAWEYPAGPPDTVEGSVRGMLQVIDAATRDRYSGQFVTQTGQVLPW